MTWWFLSFTYFTFPVLIKYSKILSWSQVHNTHTWVACVSNSLLQYVIEFFNTLLIFGNFNFDFLEFNIHQISMLIIRLRKLLDFIFLFVESRLYFFTFLHLFTELNYFLFYFPLLLFFIFDDLKLIFFWDHLPLNIYLWWFSRFNSFPLFQSCSTIVYMISIGGLWQDG